LELEQECARAVQAPVVSHQFSSVTNPRAKVFLTTPLDAAPPRCMFCVVQSSRVERGGSLSARFYFLMSSEDSSSIAGKALAISCGAIVVLIILAIVGAVIYDQWWTHNDGIKKLHNEMQMFGADFRDAKDLQFHIDYVFSGAESHWFRVTLTPEQVRSVEDELMQRAAEDFQGPAVVASTQPVPGNSTLEWWQPESERQARVFEIRTRPPRADIKPWTTCWVCCSESSGHVYLYVVGH
jgi:hypothetical protein